MKHTLILWLMLLGLLACQDDDSGFDITVSKDELRFTKVPGGAVMHYNLPRNGDLFAVHVRYRDDQNVEVLKRGGYGSDSLVLDGFNKARENISARVTFANRSNKESAPIDVTFNSDDSAPYACLKTAKVTSYWGGFQVEYEAPELVSGMMHVFYIGTNPETHQPDTVLVRSQPISKGGDTLRFVLKQVRDFNTVVLRTEDYRGYRVAQKVWENVETYFAEMVRPSDFEFFDGGLSFENGEAKSGVKYLFDGELKGEQRVAAGVNKEVYTYVAGPGAVGKPFIVDLKTEKLLAYVRIYGMLKNNRLKYTSGPLASVWNSHYEDKLPCHVTVYGANEKDGDDASWTKLGSFEQDPRLATANRWSANCYFGQFDAAIDIEKSVPSYMEVQLPVLTTKYRYLKLIVNDVFGDGMRGEASYNTSRYVTMHELEVYVKKD